MASPIDPLRVRALNAHGPNAAGDCVLYWMTSARRVHYNEGIRYSVELAHQYKKPLVIFEALRCGYPWASDRIQAFMLEGMAGNAKEFLKYPVIYYPYVEPSPGAGKGLLFQLAARASAVVGDDYPAFFLPRMLLSAARHPDMRVPFFAVDSNGLLPMRASPKIFSVARSFRSFLLKAWPAHFKYPIARDSLGQIALQKPSKELIARIQGIQQKYPPIQIQHINTNLDGILNGLPIDHSVPRLKSVQGGARAAEKILNAFIRTKLGHYDTIRDDPDEDGQSGLSPYLHAGHIGAAQVFEQAAAYMGWTSERFGADPKTEEDRFAFWGMGKAANAFVDQLVTWRELGFNMCSLNPNYDRFESLPDWAKATLAKHAADTRAYVYTREAFEQARTHDVLWNAAQNQLLREGTIHNYLRMLWGKKILEWSKTPEDALNTMIELNNKYALDGRDPNSYSGIFWVLGRYDRAWGPERPIFGTVRYMSSAAAKQKLRLKGYVERFGSKV